MTCLSTASVSAAMPRCRLSSYLAQASSCLLVEVNLSGVGYFLGLADESRVKLILRFRS
jgi:hypothetical protein